MSNISQWSTTAASNNSASPDGFPEGMAPSGVNDAAREVMAAIRAWYVDAAWTDLGHTPTYVSASSFTIPTDVTATYEANRRVKLYGTTMGTLYGTISSSSYSTPDTTINVTLDSGSLTSNLSQVYIGVQPASNDALPRKIYSAADIANTPAGNISSTELQATVNELDAEKAGLALANDFTKRQTWQFGANIASASTITLGTDGNAFHITGSATTNDFTHITGAGPFLLITDGTPTFTHAAGVLETNTGASITASAGDRFLLAQDSDNTTWLLTQLGAGGGAVFTKSFTSAEQTITSGGTLTLAHSLGVIPEMVQCRLVCKTAEANYSVGDIINADFQQTDAAINTLGYAWNVDATNVGIVFGTNAKVFLTKNKTTNAIIQLTNANWKLVVKAWA